MTNILLIGIGRWGTNILNTLETIPDVKVVKENGGRVDGVIIATPGSTHAEIALPFIKQGWPVFIEKPMTTNLADAKKLEAAAKKSNSRLFIGHIHLYNPAYLKAKELVNKLGTIRLLHFEGMAPGPVRDDLSVLWDWGPHGLSMAFDLLGKRPLRVRAWGARVSAKNTHDDIIQAHYQFPDEVELFMTCSWVSPEKRTRLTVIGSKGSLVFDDRAAHKVVLYINGKEERPQYGLISPLENELRAFLRVVSTGQGDALYPTGSAVVRALAGAEKSARLAGRKVTC